MPKELIDFLSPEVLPDRPLLKTNEYAQAGEVTSLDNVNVEFYEGTSTTKPHTYSSSKGEGVLATRLRRYATILSRYSVPNAKKRTKQACCSESALIAANRVMSNIMFQHTFGEDPTTGTIDVTQFGNYLASQPVPSEMLLHRAMGLWETGAWDTLVKTVAKTNKQLAARLDARSADPLHLLKRKNSLRNAPRFLNSAKSRERIVAVSDYEWLAREIQGVSDDIINRAVNEAEAKRIEKTNVTNPDGSIRYKKVRLVEEGLDGWETLRVSKPELTINHTGKLGRRTIAVNTGKFPRYLNRIVTDPEKRIFSRKTRALGGVVVIDNSGSMRLSDEDLDKLMEASAGATVVMYSGGIQSSPNVWLIARQGRMVRHIPEVPGNNGIDGPALVWATQFRRRRSVPIIWVSDGQVTGVGDISSDELRSQCKKLQVKHNIVRVQNVERATQLMNKLQRRSNR